MNGMVNIKLFLQQLRQLQQPEVKAKAYQTPQGAADYDKALAYGLKLEELIAQRIGLNGLGDLDELGLPFIVYPLGVAATWIAGKVGSTYVTNKTTQNSADDVFSETVANGGSVEDANRARAEYIASSSRNGFGFGSMFESPVMKYGMLALAGLFVVKKVSD